LGVGEAPNVNLVLARKACVYSTRGIENLHKELVELSLVYVKDGLPFVNISAATGEAPNSTLHIRFLLSLSNKIAPVKIIPDLPEGST
jgi:hypothetical protein